MKILPESGLCTWNRQLDYDEEVQFRAVEALRDIARCRDGRPFFLCASYTHPHDPFLTTCRWWGLYDHAAIDMPTAPPLALADTHPMNRWLQVHHMVNTHPPAEEHVRNARHAFYGMVSYFDDKVGQLLAELQRIGLGENTIVVVTSDHGEMLGEHGMWFKRTFYDEAVRVPLLVANAPGATGGRRIERTVDVRAGPVIRMQAGRRVLLTQPQARREPFGLLG